MNFKIEIKNSNFCNSKILDVIFLVIDIYDDILLVMIVR